MKKYNPIKSEDKIMNEPLSKTEREFLDSIDLTAYETENVPKNGIDAFGYKIKKIKEMTRGKK